MPIIKLIIDTLAPDEHTIIHNGVLYDIGTKLRDMSMTCSIISAKTAKATKIMAVRTSHKYLADEDAGMVSDLLTGE
jgi:hypothetical protein